MDLYYNGTFVIKLPLSPQHTVGQLKYVIDTWMTQQGVHGYTIRIIMPNKEELHPAVLRGTDYDDTTFEAYGNQMDQISVYVTPDMPIANKYEYDERERAYIDPYNNMVNYQALLENNIDMPAELFGHYYNKAVKQNMRLLPNELSFHAAQAGNLDVIKFLLRHGARNYDVIIHNAGIRGYQDIVNYINGLQR